MSPTDDQSSQLLEISKRLRAVADITRVYAHDDYDLERAREIENISAHIISLITGFPTERIAGFYTEKTDYPTPKVDVRAIVLNPQGQLLVVQEKADGKWSLPGGWADIGSTPAENVETEVHEETGLVVRASNLLAVYDKRKHAHPPQPFYVYKLFFHCLLQSNPDTPLAPAFDILAAAWFDLDSLPPLSTDRVLESQINRLCEKVRNGDFHTVFD